MQRNKIVVVYVLLMTFVISGVLIDSAEAHPRQVNVKANRVFRLNKGEDFMDTYTDYPLNGYGNASLNWLVLNDGGQKTYVQKIYNLVNTSSTEHMSSEQQVENGYMLSDWLGFAFNAIDYSQGILPIERFVKTDDNGDMYHKTAAHGEVMGGGYQLDKTIGYGWTSGYIEHGTFPDEMIHYMNYDDERLDKIRVGTTPVWGGTVVSIMKDGVEYVNRWDQGREVQTTFRFHTNYNGSYYACEYTEGGDKRGNGSPIVNYLHNFPVKRMMLTESNALRWGEGEKSIDPTYPTADHPIVSGTIIGKRLAIESDTRIRYSRNVTLGKPFYLNAPYGKIPCGNKIDKSDATSLFLVADFDHIECYEVFNRKKILKESVTLTIGKCEKAITITKNSDNSVIYFIATNSKDPTKCIAYLHPSPKNNSSIRTDCYLKWDGEGKTEPVGNTANDYATIFINFSDWYFGELDMSTRSQDLYVFVGTPTEVNKEIDNFINPVSPAIYELLSN